MEASKRPMKDSRTLPIQRCDAAHRLRHRCPCPHFSVSLWWISPLSFTQVPSVCSVLSVVEALLTQPHLNPRPRIEIVPQPVADEVERQHRQHDCRGREEHKVRRVKQVRPRVIEHRTPARRRRRHAQSQKAHRRFRQDRARHADRRLHDHRLNNVRQNVARDDPYIARAHGPRAFHKFPLPHRQNLRAHQPGIPHPPANRERQDKVEQSRPEETPRTQLPAEFPGTT